MTNRDVHRSKVDALQLKVLQVLWARKEATVLEIQQELAKERELAVTTVGTVLRRLDKKGLVTYRKDGRQYIYQALISEEESKSNVISDLVDNWFKGKPSALVNHLIQSNEIDHSDLEALKHIVEQARAKVKK
jgi:BlaI family penicillinase repressor